MPRPDISATPGPDYDRTMGRRGWVLVGLVVIVLLAALQLPGVDLSSERTSIDGGFPSELVPGIAAVGALAVLPLVALAIWVLRHGRHRD